MAHIPAERLFEAVRPPAPRPAKKGTTRWIYCVEPLEDCMRFILHRHRFGARKVRRHLRRTV